MLGSLSAVEIETVLSSNVLGRIGCTDGNIVYVVPVTYLYDGRYIIAHSRDGMKIDIMRKNPNICFEIDVMHNMNKWESVIAWGTYEELTDETEKYYAMKKLVDRMMKLKLSETAQPPHLSGNRVYTHEPGNVKAIVYRIELKEKTGRFEL